MGSSPTQSTMPKCVGQVTHTIRMSMNLIEYDLVGHIDSLFERNGSEIRQRDLPPMRQVSWNLRRRYETTACVPTTAFVEHFQEYMRAVRDAVYSAGEGRNVFPSNDWAFEPDVSCMMRTASMFRAIHERRLVWGSEYTRGAYDAGICTQLSVYRGGGMDLFYKMQGFDFMNSSQGTLQGFMYKAIAYVNDKLEDIERATRVESMAIDGTSIWVRSLKQLGGFIGSLEGKDTSRYAPGLSTIALKMNIRIGENFVELKKKSSMGDFVLDYEGNKIPSNEAIVLTAQSDFEGEYIHTGDAIVRDYVRVWGGTSSVVLTPDDDDRTLELVGGDIIWEPDFSDDIRYLDAGSRDGEWAWVDDVLWCQSDGCYYHNEDEGDYVFWDSRREEYVDHEPRGSSTHEYHSGFRRVFYTDDTKFTIGFEVEKEDSSIFDHHDLDDADATDWCRESDGSLGDDGYEMVSPVYDMFTDDLDVALNGKTRTSRTLVDHINAEYTSNCGGHINIGQIGKNGEEFFDSIQAFVPLFLSIWRHRLGNSYSQIKRKPADYKSAGKYSAVHVKGRYIELRLPPAVRNVTNLLWRRDLIRIMCENQNVKPLNVISMMLNPKSKLHIHLRKVYSADMIHKIVSLYAQFADDLYSSYDFTSDGVGVFIKSAVRRLKNRKVKGTSIVYNASEAVDRLSNSFGAVYNMDTKKTQEYLQKVRDEE